MIIILSKIFSKSFQGMAIYPFIILKYKHLKNNKRIINHEKIHLRQQIELLWIFFFIIYLIEFSLYYFKHRNLMKAYHSISFEKEAYANEHNLNYLKNRSFFNFLKYYK